MVVQLIQNLVWILLSGESMDPLKPFEWIWMVVQLATNTVQMVSPRVYKTNGHFWKWKFWMVSNGLSVGGLMQGEPLHWFCCWNCHLTYFNSHETKQTKKQVPSLLLAINNPVDAQCQQFKLHVCISFFVFAIGSETTTSRHSKYQSRKPTDNHYRCPTNKAGYVVHSYQEISISHIHMVVLTAPSKLQINQLQINQSLGLNGQYFKIITPLFSWKSKLSHFQKM